MSAGRVLGGGLTSWAREVAAVEEVEGTVEDDSGCAEEEERVCVLDEEGEAYVRAAVTWLKMLMCDGDLAEVKTGGREGEKRARWPRREGGIAAWNEVVNLNERRREKNEAVDGN